VLALALYSMLPVLRNTITPAGVEPAILEAAQGVGMTEAAVRCSWLNCRWAAGDDGGHSHRAVWVIAPRRYPLQLDNPASAITSSPDLQTQNWVFVLFGCLAAAVLALAVDHCWP